MIEINDAKNMNFKSSLQVLFMIALAAFPAVGHAAPPVTPEALVGAKPAKDFRGRYPALVKSMMSGQARSITLGNVYKYGRPQLGSYNNQLYWMVPVEYARLVSPGNDDHARGYGMIMGDALACVRHGRVEFWIYKTSRGQMR